jgi:hypothetical protein
MSPKVKNNKIMKKIKILFATFCAIYCFNNVHAQVGIGTTTPAAALDITATDNGLLIPRVALTSTLTVAPVTTGTTSELVYNTSTTGDVTPGFYYLSSATGPWIRLATATPFVEIDPKVSSTINNRVPRWNVATTTLVNGIITDTGTLIGINNATPAGALDITSTNNGLLIPRVALSSTSTLTVATPTTSELVYNTATTGDVTPGFYYLSAAAGPWLRLGGGPEVDPQVSSGTINQVPKWNGTTLVDGAITDTGSTVGINSPTPAGALDINSTTDGMVIPRVALNGLNFASPLTTPVTSELVYNNIDNSTVLSGPALIAAGLVTPGFYFWNGTRWERFVTGALPPSTGWQTTGNTGIVDGTNFIGTTTAANIQFRRNNLHAGRIAATSTSFGLNALTAGAATNGTAFGVNALAVNTAANNTAFGTNALAANTTSANNTAFGHNALAVNTPSTDSGAQNTAIGSGALASLNGGNNNTAVGFNALTALGGLSLFNTAVGSNALKNISAQASQENVAVGYNALGNTGATITGSVAVGANALLNANNNTTRNTAVGLNAGSAITSGSDNVVIGANAQVPTASGSNQVRIGGTSIGYAGVQVAWTVTSDERWKNEIKDSALGLDFLQTLRPVSYVRNNDVKAKTEYGFIAQELEAALITAGDPNNAIISKDDAGMYGVRYNDFISISVKAIQEQQEQIEELKKTNAELLKMNELVLKRLEALEQK